MASSASTMMLSAFTEGEHTRFRDIYEIHKQIITWERGQLSRIFNKNLHPYEIQRFNRIGDIPRRSPGQRLISLKLGEYCSYLGLAEIRSFVQSCTVIP